MISKIAPQDPCPCGTGQTYSQCCQPCHQGEPASNPETLMRSRYSAFVTGNTAYLTATWHPETRPDGMTLEDSPAWVSLRILAREQNADSGQVHFQAFYREAGHWACLEEKSRFERIHGHWYYLDGNTSQGVYRPGRNEKCPCGSGSKAKTCCGT